MSDVIPPAYAAQPEHLQHACRVLALPRGPFFSADAAAAALQADPLATGTTLGQLQAAGVLEHDPGTDQWRMPSRVLAYARTLLDEIPKAERVGIVARTVRHYLLWAANLDRLITPDRLRYAPVFTWLPEHPPAVDTADQAVELLHTWMPTLVAAQAQAAETGLHQLAWQFLDALWGYLTRQHNYRAWRKVCNVGENSAHYVKDPGALTLYHAFAGLLDRHCGHPKRALDHHAQAERRALEAGDTLTQAAAAKDQGAALLRLNQPQKALEVLQHGLALHRVAAAPHSRGRGLLERHLGIALAKLGRDDEAEEHLQAAERVFIEYDEPYLRAHLSLDRAQLALDAEDPAGVLEHLAQAKQQFSGWSVPDKARLHYLTAAAHTQTGDRGVAARTLDIAIPLTKDLPRGHPTALLIRGLAEPSAGATA
ncbi:tetratricopeptide repeat protein [Actinomadura sp. NPDC023710]|uniref:tetratricopeptide repeat protein n=1 Tax=Actinomadura sp. NPDC023710 TaxID=3158219 RepID=UPI003404C5CA